MEEEQQPGIYHRHRYPTRFSLRKCITSSSQSQVPGVKNKADEKGIVAYRKRIARRGRHTIISTPSPQVLGVKSKAHDQGLVACRKSMKGEHITISTPYLSVDIIFKILLLLPATVLNEVMRYVCKTWNSIVSDPLFISAHANLALTSASPGMIIQDPAKLDRTFYLETSSSSNDLFKFRVTELKIPFPAVLLGSFNGLVLLQDNMCPEKLHLMNLVTGVIISTLPRAIGLGRFDARCYDTRLLFCLAYVASSGQYKVLRVSGSIYSSKVQVYVCTVGVDRHWRVIKTIYNPTEEDAAFGSTSQFINGFVYWFNPHWGPSGFAWDVETETMYHFSAPKDIDDDDLYPKHCINMETGIGFVDECLYKEWEIWELVDPRSGNWIKVNFGIKDMMNKLKQAQIKLCKRTPEPLFVLKNGHMYFYHCIKIDEDELDSAKNFKLVLMCYDMRTGRLSDTFPITFTGIEARVFTYLHVNTLLPPLKNC